MMAPRVSAWAQSVPKFASQLTVPATLVSVGGAGNYTVTMSEFSVQILPAGYPATRVWGYSGATASGLVQSYPGPSFEVTRGQAARVTFVNNITGRHLFAVDPTLHWANPNGAPHPTFPFSGVAGNATFLQPVPLVPHLHGAECGSGSDGHPEAWWTSTGVRGSAYSSPGGIAASDSAVFLYPNQQPPSTLWYHDHALGLTRLNVYAGLAGFYILRDAADSLAATLPSGVYDVPLMLQDKSFNETDGSLLFPSDGDNPSAHPFWKMQFLGDVIVVNGKAWPNLNVNKGQYLFRLLDGANARFFNISLYSGSTQLSFTVIANDGGYLRAPAVVTSLLLGPGDRFSILVDFASFATGDVIRMRNTAAAPFSDGPAPDPLSTGLVMQFTVQAAAGFAAQSLPAVLNPVLATYPSLPSPSVVRTMVLVADISATNGLTTQLLLNGVPWMAPVSEYPVLNATEEWTIINLAGDVHPIHLHLSPFQVIRRQSANLLNYKNDWLALNGAPPFANSFALDPTPYLTGSATLADPIDQGFQDAVSVGLEAVTFRVRFAPIDGASAFPFDATAGPGYVWHCHILDHEDNDMMRPMKVVSSSFVPPTTATRTTVPPTTTTAPAVTSVPAARNCTTVTVNVASQSFLPSSVNVQIGDTLKFVFSGTSFHNLASVSSSITCIPNDAWRMGAPKAGPGFEYNVSINAANGFFTPNQRYDYICELHCIVAGMRGSIFVDGVCDSSALTTSTTTPGATTTAAATSTTAAVTTRPAAGVALAQLLVVLVITNIFFAIV